MRVRLILPLLLLCAVHSGTLFAQTGQAASLPQLIREWNAYLEDSGRQLSRSGLSEGALKRLRGKLTEIRDRARSARDEIASGAEPLREELDALGAPPAEGAPKEPAAIANKRQSLNDRLAAIDGQVKEIELIVSRAEKSLQRISAVRIDRFTREIFKRGFSPVDPDVWQKALPDLEEKIGAITERFKRWRSREGFGETWRSTAIHLVLALLVVLAVVWPFTRWVSKKVGRLPGEEPPSYLELLRTALAVAVIRIALPVAIAGVAFLVLNHDLHWNKGARDIASAIFLAYLMIVLVMAVSRAILAPSRSRWRLMPLDDEDARYVHKVIIGLACVFAVDLVLDHWLSAAGTSLELTVVRKFVAGLLITGLLFAVLIRRTLWRTDVEHRRRRSDKATLWRGLRGAIAILVLAIPVSAMVGYVALSRLLAAQIVLTGGLYVLVRVIIALCTELVDEVLNKQTAIGSNIRQQLELTDEGSELLAFWLNAAVSLVVFVGALLALLVIWGAGGEDLSEWLYKALFGFRIGEVTVSIATIFMAVALFAGVLVLTRLFQRFLEHRILPRTRIDFGIQNSIRASVGYLGFIIAAVVAISTLGIDLTKLAIIAGALSVGIGFGLQNVVNNFVSGLILLIERPIKVGDWVVIGDKQGYVKKVKVRATEILTFDRASVFIPNSDLISHPLLNWTHADKTGRIVIPVGVAYGSDTQKVRDILLAVAEAHPAVFQSPAPTVLLRGFGDNALNFELRAFVQDVDKVLTVNSDLCFEIDAAFRREGIAIPYPQRDVHWKDMERIERLVAQILSDKKS